MISFVVQDVPDAFRQRARLRRWLLGVARDHGTTVGDLSFVLMNDKALLQYNKTYLGHVDLTDVITFPVDGVSGVSGDVLISYDRVRDNAKQFAASASEELRRVMVHGLLHLLGHMDKSQAARAIMRAAEDKYLALYRGIRG